MDSLKEHYQQLQNQINKREEIEMQQEDRVISILPDISPKSDIANERSGNDKEQGVVSTNDIEEVNTSIEHLEREIGRLLNELNNLRSEKEDILNAMEDSKRSNK